jgi:hypothetical protein
MQVRGWLRSVALAGLGLMTNCLLFEMTVWVSYGVAIMKVYVKGWTIGGSSCE